MIILCLFFIVFVKWEGWGVVIGSGRFGDRFSRSNDFIGVFKVIVIVEWYGYFFLFFFILVRKFWL